MSGLLMVCHSAKKHLAKSKSLRRKTTLRTLGIGQVIWRPHLPVASNLPIAGI